MGIRTFDTAQAYGASEEVLGCCLNELDQVETQDPPRVISKIHPEVSPEDISMLLKGLDGSLERLRTDSLYGLMMHRESWLDVFRGALKECIRRLKDQKKIANFGVSAYSMDGAFKALANEEIDLIQVPFNVLDQRALTSGFLEKAAEKGKTVYIRSLYLQGLLLMEPDELPSRMDHCRKSLEDFRKVVRRSGITSKQLALGFVLQNAPNASIVFGAETARQVRENVSLGQASLSVNLPRMDHLAVGNEEIIDPSRWPH